MENEHKQRGQSQNQRYMLLSLHLWPIFVSFCRSSLQFISVQAQKKLPLKETPESSDTPSVQPEAAAISELAVSPEGIRNHMEDDDGKHGDSTVDKQSELEVSLDVEAANVVTSSVTNVEITDKNEPDSVNVEVGDAVEKSDHLHIGEAIGEGQSSTEQNKDVIPIAQELGAAEEKVDNFDQSTSVGDADVSSDVTRNKPSLLKIHSNGDHSEKENNSESKLESVSVPPKEGQNVDSSKKVVEEQLDEVIYQNFLGLYCGGKCHVCPLRLLLSPYIWNYFRHTVFLKVPTPVVSPKKQGLQG